MTNFRLILIDERDGQWFADGVHVRVSDGTRHGFMLHPETAQALGFTRRRVMGSAAYYRVLKCVNCGQRFIGHNARKSCSDACASEQLAKAQRRIADADAERKAQMAAARAARAAAALLRPKTPRRCAVCYAPLVNAKRKS